MQKYHIVLIPDAKVAVAAEEFAQSHFAHDHEDYCIGSDGHLPHITIAQTDVPDEFVVEDLYAAILKLDWNEDNILQFGDYYHHKDKHYNGVEILLSEELKNLHNQVIEIHNHLGLSMNGKSTDDYWPHMTFAKTPFYLREPVILPKKLQGSADGWRLEFGNRGENGVYLGRYEPE